MFKKIPKVKYRNITYKKFKRQKKFLQKREKGLSDLKWKTYLGSDKLQKNLLHFLIHLHMNQSISILKTVLCFSLEKL